MIIIDYIKKLLLFDPKSQALTRKVLAMLSTDCAMSTNATIGINNSLPLAFAE